MKAVSIVIPCYNSESHIVSCLNSIMQSDYPNFEVILVDNASKDSTYALIKACFSNLPNLKLIRLPWNHGFAKACNIGSRQAKGEYLVFINSDTIIEDRQWLSKLVSYMEACPEVVVLQAKLVRFDNPDIIDSAGGFIDKFGFGLTRGHGEIDRKQYDVPSYIFFAGGAAMIIKRSFWEAVGGFDPTYFFYYEDIDISWQAWKMGYKVAYYPSVIVKHIGHGSTPKDSYMDRDLYYRIKYAIAKGRLYLLIKNYELVDIIRYVPVTFMIQVANALRYIAKRDKLAGMATLIGTFSIILEFKNAWSRRTRHCKTTLKIPFLHGIHIKLS